MSSRRCEECGALLNPAKVLRCTKCKACFYCSAVCQKRNWKRIHKRVCSTDPLLRRFVPAEMAVERALALQPPMEQAPKQAFCYICLDGEDGGKSSKLMRGCACRGDSAGFVHLDCLTELAMSKEASGNGQAIIDGWQYCGNCKQLFQGALGLEMRRRFWRQHRSGQHQGVRYVSLRSLANSLGASDELDAANQLIDEASTWVGNNRVALLELNLMRASMLKKNGQAIEALGLLQAILPEAKVYTANPSLCGRAMLDMADVLLRLHRNQEAHDIAIEFVTFANTTCGPEDNRTLHAIVTYAVACAHLGRVEESKANFEYVLTTQTRILGREHRDTQETRRVMAGFGFAVPSG